MNAPNRTSIAVPVLSAVGFAVLGLVFYGAARLGSHPMVPAVMMAVLLSVCGWLGLRAVLGRHPDRHVRLSAHVLLWLSSVLLLAGAAMWLLFPELATDTPAMQIVSGCIPLVGIALYWAILARKRAAER
jgi:RsiW-degrading membrane proteinase PrsW (M82 family)